MQDFRKPGWVTGYVSASISNFMVFQRLQKSVTCNSKHLRPSCVLFWYIKGPFWYHKQHLKNFFNKLWDKFWFNNDVSKLACLYHRLNVLQIKMINPVVIPVFGNWIMLIVQFVCINFILIANEHYFRKWFWKMVKTVKSIELALENRKFHIANSCCSYCFSDELLLQTQRTFIVASV